MIPLIFQMHMLDNCILINPHLPTTPEFQHGSRMNSNPRKRSHKLSRRSNMGGEGSSQQGVPSSQDVDMESVTVLRDGLIGCAASTIKKQGATSVKEEGTIVPDKEPMFSPYPKTLEPFPEINAAIMVGFYLIVSYHQLETLCTQEQNTNCLRNILRRETTSPCEKKKMRTWKELFISYFQT